MKRQQFYHIEFRSEFLYREDVKIKVDSKEELKEWIKSDMEDMLREFKNPYHGMSQEQREEQDQKIKKSINVSWKVLCIMIQKRVENTLA